MAEEKVSKLIGPITLEDPKLISITGLVTGEKYLEAKELIDNIARELTTPVSGNRLYKHFAQDGFIAAHASISALFGMYTPIGGQHSTTEVEVAPGVMRQTAIGKLELPGVEGLVHLGWNDRQFQLSWKVQKRHIPKVIALADAVGKRLEEASIYMGEAVDMVWTEGGFFSSPGFEAPTFMDLNPPLTESDLILSDDLYKQVEANIFSFIRNREVLRSMGVPSKRLVLLAGEYGCGKSLTAKIAASVCKASKRTFFNLKDVRRLGELARVANVYSPACVFAEDIDSASEDEIDAIANTIDAIDTKGLDVLFVLTTNHADKLPAKFKRDGRSDQIIVFEPPDEFAAMRLIRAYGGAWLDQEALGTAGEVAAQLMAENRMIPAAIRGVVESAKLFAVASGRRLVTGEDLRLSAVQGVAMKAMRGQNGKTGLPPNMKEIGLLVKQY